MAYFLSVHFSIPSSFFGVIIICYSCLYVIYALAVTDVFLNRLYATNNINVLYLLYCTL